MKLGKFNLHSTVLDSNISLKYQTCNIKLAQVNSFYYFSGLKNNIYREIYYNPLTAKFPMILMGNSPNKLFPMSSPKSPKLGKFPISTNTVIHAFIREGFHFISSRNWRFCHQSRILPLKSDSLLFWHGGFHEVRPKYLGILVSYFPLVHISRNLSVLFIH